MGAGDKTLWTEEWLPHKGNKKDPNAFKQTRVYCQSCGWKGKLGDTLLSEDPKNDMTYCPKCRLPSWVWA